MVETTKAERLRQARIRAGFESAAAAARSLQMPYATYAGQENGVRGFGRDYVLRYAAHFGVDPAWLEFGRPPAPAARPEPVQPVEPTIVIERLIQEREAERERLARAQETMREAGLMVSMLTVAIDRLRPQDPT